MPATLANPFARARKPLESENGVCAIRVSATSTVRYRWLVSAVRSTPALSWSVEAPRGSDTIGDAIVEALSQVNVADGLVSLTAEAIACYANCSPSSVRYRLRSRVPGSTGQRWAFDRRAALEAALGRVHERLTATTKRNVDAQLAALSQATAASDFSVYVGFLLSTRPEVDRAAERAFEIIATLGQGDPQLEARITVLQSARIALQAQVYRTVVPLLGREFRPGITAEDVAREVFAYWTGIRRLSASRDRARELDTTMAIVVALTHAADADTPARPFLCSALGQLASVR